MAPELVAHCSAVLGAHKSVMLALFIGGLTGSVSHCVAMCSPFVLAQLGEGGSSAVFSGLLLPYHLGRIATYMLLGTLSGALLALVSAYGWFALVSKWLLATAGCFFLVAALWRLPVKLPFRFAWAPRCAFKRLSSLIQAPGFSARFGLGMLLGLVPCGLVLAALMAAASTGSALAGGIGMALFGLGTAPALMAVGLAGGAFARSYSHLYRHVGTAAMGLNSVILFILAGS